MRLILHGTLRQWQQNRFLMTLLILGYGLGIGLSTLVFAAVAGRMDLEREMAIGDPMRIVEASVSPSMNQSPVALQTDLWLERLPIDWGYAVIYDRGDVILPGMQGKTIIAMLGGGPLDWSPAIRTGRFITADDIAAGAHVLLLGENLPQEIPDGYELIGTVYDVPGRERGWRNFIYLPITALPPELVEDPGSGAQLHLQVAKGADIEQVKAELHERLTAQFPDRFVQVASVADLVAKGDRNYRGALMQGAGFMAILLGFVAANVGSLSIHWVTKRRRELAVRVAMGATTGRLVQMILVEHLLIALAGGLAAIPVIWVGWLVGPQVDLPIYLSRDVLLMTVAAILATGLLSTVLPLQAMLGAPLRESLRYQD